MVGIVTGASGLAIAAGAAFVGSEAYSAYQTGQQIGVQKDALALAQDTHNEQQYYNNLLQQLIANPGSIETDPSFQFELKTGSAAVADQMSAKGFGGSGNEGAALTTFGQGLASTFYGQQASLLASLSGLTAPSSPAQDINAATSAGAQSTNTLSQLLNSLGFFGTLGYKSGMFGGASAGTPAALAGPTSGVSTSPTSSFASEFAGSLA